MATVKRNSRASIRKQMNQKVQAVLKLKVEQFTEIAAQEEAIELATIESAKAIRKLQDNGVTMDEAADSTGLSVNRLRAIIKRAEELERLEDRTIHRSQICWIILRKISSLCLVKTFRYSNSREKNAQRLLSPACVV